MDRLSNRQHSQKSESVVQYVFVEKPAVEIIVPSSQPQIIYQDREVQVEKIVEVSADAAPIKEWSQKRLDEQNIAHALLLKDHKEHNDRRFELIKNELEMQRQAIVGLISQREIDRSRRLMLIKRMKKGQAESQKSNFKLRLAVGVSLLLTVLLLYKNS